MKKTRGFQSRQPSDSSPVPLVLVAGSQVAQQPAASVSCMQHPPRSSLALQGPRPAKNKQRLCQEGTHAKAIRWPIGGMLGSAAFSCTGCKRYPEKENLGHTAAHDRHRRIPDAYCLPNKSQNIRPVSQHAPQALIKQASGHASTCVQLCTNNGYVQTEAPRTLAAQAAPSPSSPCSR